MSVYEHSASTGVKTHACTVMRPANSEGRSSSSSDCSSLRTVRIRPVGVTNQWDMDWLHDDTVDGAQFILAGLWTTEEAQQGVIILQAIGG